MRAVVTDIEGTTSSNEFVQQILFPYATVRMGWFLRTHAQRDEVRAALAEIDRVVGRVLSLEEHISVVEQWIAEDRKITPLKSLQGMIWRLGYESGELVGHVFADVPIYLRGWSEAGKRLYVYSSGSEEAQRLLFSHTVAGDLSVLFAGYFDTRIGAKHEPAAYARIRDRLDLSADEILFLSDVGRELDAARTVGMQTCQLVRDDRCVLAPAHPHARDFSEVDEAFDSSP